MENKPSMLEKFTKYSIITSYCFGIVFLVIDIFIACVTLIFTKGVAKPGVVYSVYALMILAAINLLLYATLTALYFVGDTEDRLSRKRIEATRYIRISTRVINFIFGAIIVTVYYLNKKSITGNQNYDSFLALMSYIYLILFFVLFIYGLWKNAWINENPERYTYYGEIIPYKDDEQDINEYQKYHSPNRQNNKEFSYTDATIIENEDDTKVLNNNPKQLTNDTKKLTYKEKKKEKHKKKSS